MHESDRSQLIALTEKRITALESTLSDYLSTADKKKSQAGDAAANLDLMITASIDEKVQSEYKLELAQLKKNLSWLQTDMAGKCVRCNGDIPIGRLKAILGARLCMACADSS
jgi:RNA polymerase-binding transcription factor DksA